MAIIDLTNYRDRTSAYVKPGTYRVVIEDVEKGTSQGEKTKGAEMFTLYMRVVGGEFDGANLVDRLIVAEKTLFRVVGFLQGLGIPTPRKRFSVDENRWKGRQTDVTVRDGQPYNGVVRTEVASYQRVAKAEQAGGGEDLDDMTAGEAEAEHVAADDTSSKVADLDDATPAEQAAPTADTLDSVDLDEVDL